MNNSFNLIAGLFSGIALLFTKGNIPNWLSMLLVVLTLLNFIIFAATN